MLPGLATVLQIALAEALTISVIGKITAKARFRRTIIDLGIPVSVSWIVAVGVMVGEWSLAVALLIRPDRTLLVLTLAVCLLLAFAVAGVIGLRAEQKIECHCFGASSAQALGWRQIGQLPPVLAAVVIVNVFARHRGLVVGINLVDAVQLVAAAYFAGRFAMTLARVRGQRLSLGQFHAAATVPIGIQ